MSFGIVGWEIGEEWGQWMIIWSSLPTFAGGGIRGSVARCMEYRYVFCQDPGGRGHILWLEYKFGAAKAGFREFADSGPVEIGWCQCAVNLLGQC